MIKSLSGRDEVWEFLKKSDKSVVCVRLLNNKSLELSCQCYHRLTTSQVKIYVLVGTFPICYAILLHFYGFLLTGFDCFPCML